MATQSNDGVPLTLVAEVERKHFRLLELPAEILALLTSDNPPVLELKASGTQGGEDAGIAVLCTPDKTFNLRQKNSSNTVYILQPHESPNGMYGGGLHAIAQCHSTLELSALKPLAGSAGDHLKTILPVYSSTGIASSSLDRRALFDLMPYSEQECEQAFQRLAAFVHPESACVYRPSAALAVQAWRGVLTAGLAQGVDFQQPLTSGAVLSVTTADSAVDTAIAQAVLDALTKPSADDSVVLISEECVGWLGQTLLEAEAGVHEVPAKTFLEKWKDLLPEKWRDLAELSKIAAYWQSNDNGKSVALKRSGTSASTDQSVTGTSSAAGSKRKWHEKFRPTKK